MSSAPVRSLADLKTHFGMSEDEGRALEEYDRCLLEAQSHTNLIARPSIEDRWDRHYADSAQLYPLIPDGAHTILDIGSGAGFPGLVLAAMAQCRGAGLQWTLVDSVQKKARFLRETASAMGLTNVDVSDQRAEVFHVKQAKFDVIIARAVASLDKLLPIAAPLMAPGGLLLFPKGEKADLEVAEAHSQWTFEVESRPSMTHDRAKILLIRRPEPRQ